MVIFLNDVRSPETSEDAPFLCELFALSSRLPATVSLSLETLAEHGGGSAPHADGWGIAYYREDDVRLIKDTSAAYESDWVRFVQSRSDWYDGKYGGRPTAGNSLALPSALSECRDRIGNGHR